MRKSRIQSQSEEFMPRSVSLTASLAGTIVLKAELESNEKQPYIVAIFAVNWRFSTVWYCSTTKSRFVQKVYT